MSQRYFCRFLSKLIPATTELLRAKSKDRIKIEELPYTPIKSFEIANGVVIEGCLLVVVC